MTRFDYTAAGTMSWEALAKAILASQQRLAADEELSGSPRAWKVWCACMDLTASWRKRSDRVHVATIGNRAGIRPDKVSPILRRFHDLGIVSWAKVEGTRSSGLLSLPPVVLKERNGDGEVQSSRPRKAKPSCPKCGSTDLSHSDSEQYGRLWTCHAEACHWTWKT